MADELLLRRTSPDTESFATVYTHPEFGEVDVGRISLRAGAPHAPRQWSWSIGVVAKPGLSHGQQGTADTRKAATEAWKRAWPNFRDARSDAEWHDIREAQDASAKRLMIIDARKVTGLTPAQLAELTAEMGRPGPAPHWLLELLKK